MVCHNMCFDANPPLRYPVPNEAVDGGSPDSVDNQLLPQFPDDLPIADIKVISLSRLNQGDRKESYELFKACCEYGFFHLDLRDNLATERENSAASLLNVLPSLFQMSKQLHHLPDSEKSALTYDPPRQLFGYKALGRNKVEDGNPDRYEAWTFARDDFFEYDSTTASINRDKQTLVPARPRMPDMISKYQTMIQSYIWATNDIIQLICSHLDRHLGLRSGSLADLQCLCLRSQSSIRLLRYPPHGNSAVLAHPQKSLVGHTDIGTITILADNGIGGLQVLPPGATTSADSEWKYVRPKSGCVVVNIGDAMTEWSGGLLRSDLHRVVSPPGEQTGMVRYSIAYLARPARDVRMEPLKEAWKMKFDHLRQDRAGDHGCADTKVWTALEWEIRKSQSIINGSDVAHSKGGIPVERWSRTE